LTGNVSAQPEIYAKAAQDPVGFWADEARRLTWATPWSSPLDGGFPHPSWFAGGTLNVAVNCVDRHVDAGNGDRVALHWEGGPGDTRTITYRQLQADVCRAANALAELGVEPDAAVAICMPPLPEAVVAMLACARLGARHHFIFPRPHAEVLTRLIRQTGARLVISADGDRSPGTMGPLKPALDEALGACPQVARVLIVRRTGWPIDWVKGRDVWWNDLVDRQPDSVVIRQPGDSARMLLYSSAGFLTHVAATHRLAFDVQPDSDVCWYAAHPATMGSHAYAVYGALAGGATCVLLEGPPVMTAQTSGRINLRPVVADLKYARCWDIIERYGVTILDLPPSLIQAIARSPGHPPAKRRLSSLRLLTSDIEALELAGGRMLDPSACRSWRTAIGQDHIPFVTNWSNSLTGGIMLTPLPGMVGAIEPEEGAPCWSRFEGVFSTGDKARRDCDGDLWMVPRSGDM
jgi:acetyl-CoA synthetase